MGHGISLLSVQLRLCALPHGAPRGGAETTDPIRGISSAWSSPNMPLQVLTRTAPHCFDFGNTYWGHHTKPLPMPLTIPLLKLLSVADPRRKRRRQRVWTDVTARFWRLCGIGLASPHDPGPIGESRFLSRAERRAVFAGGMLVRATVIVTSFKRCHGFPCISHLADINHLRGGCSRCSQRGTMIPRARISEEHSRVSKGLWVVCSGPFYSIEIWLAHEG